MANTEVLDSFVDPGGVKQFQDIQKASADATAQFLDNIKAAKELLAITGGATTSRQFAKDQLALAAATEKVVQAQQKSAQEYQKAQALSAKTATANNNQAKSLLQLQQAQDRQAAALAKTTQATQKALSPYEQLNKAHIDARNSARDLAAQYGITDARTEAATKTANGFDKQLKAIDGSLGQSQRNVGNYGSAFSKLYGYIRTAANILPGVGISGIFLAIGTAVVTLVDKLGLLDQQLKQTEISAQAFASGFKSTEYTKAIESVTALGINIEKAKHGFLDKDKVIDQYNESIGAVTGRVDSLNEAEKGLVKNAPNYIRATLLKAAANAAIADSAKRIAELAAKNQQIEDDQTNNAFTFARIAQGAFNASKTGSEASADAAKKAREKIKDNNDKIETDQKRTVSAVQNLFTQIDAIYKKFGQNSPGIGLDNSASTETALKEAVANQALERRKKQAEDIFNNDKNSFAKRIAAVKDYYDAERTISENAKAVAIKDTKASSLEQTQIFNKFDQDRLDRQVAESDKIRELQDQQSKLRIDNLKKDLDAQKQAAKLVIDDPSSSLDARLDALDKYRTKSDAIITTTNAEQVRDAGNVSEKLKGIAKDTAAARLAVTIDFTSQQTKIFQDEYTKQIALASDHDKKVINDIKSASEQQQQDIIDSQSAQLEFTAEQRAKGLISEKAYQFQVLNIQHEGNLAILRERLDAAQKLLDLETKANPDNPDIPAQQKAISDAKKGIDKENTDFKLKQFKTEDDARKELSKNEIQLAEQTAAAIKSIVDGAYQSRIDAIDRQKQAISDAADVEKKGIENSLDTQNNKAAREAVLDAQTQARQDQLTKEQQDIKRKQAIFDKALSVAQASEAAAVAEVQALTYLSNPVTAVFYPAIAATIGALYALQLGTILATPLPSYRIGTENHPGGLATVHAGELIETPTGGSYLTHAQQQILDLPRGSKVRTAERTRQMIRPEVLNGYSGGASVTMLDTQPIVKAINDKPVPKQRREDWRNLQRANEFGAYRDRRFK